MIAAFLAPLLMGLEKLTSPRLWKMASDLSGDGAITHLFLAARGFFAIDFFGADVFLEKAEVSVQRALARFHVSYFVFVPTRDSPYTASKSPPAWRNVFVIAQLFAAASASYANPASESSGVVFSGRVNPCLTFSNSASRTGNPSSFSPERHAATFSGELNGSAAPCRSKQEVEPFSEPEPSGSAI